MAVQDGEMTITQTDELFQLLNDHTDSSIEDTLVRLKRARHVFHELLASQVTSPMNDHLTTIPHDRYEDKKSMAVWINGELRELGLAIKCPNTGKDTMLCVDRQNVPTQGRFRLRPISDGSRRTYTSSRLFPLTLTSHFERIEPFTRQWVDRLRPNVQDAVKEK